MRMGKSLQAHAMHEMPPCLPPTHLKMSQKAAAIMTQSMPYMRISGRSLKALGSATPAFCRAVEEGGQGT